MLEGVNAISLPKQQCPEAERYIDPADAALLQNAQNQIVEDDDEGDDDDSFDDEDDEGEEEEDDDDDEQGYEAYSS